MCTKLPNPQYGPEVAGKTIIINYSVTLQVLFLTHIHSTSALPDLDLAPPILNMPDIERE